MCEVQNEIEYCRNTVITRNSVIVGSRTGRKDRRKTKKVELAMEICNLQLCAYLIRFRTKYYVSLTYHEESL